MFPFHIYNVRVASTSASYSVLLRAVERVPVLVFLLPLLLIRRCHLQEWGAVKLSVPWCIGRAVLDGSMPVTNVAEIMDIVRGEKCTSCQRMDRSVSPLL